MAGMDRDQQIGQLREKLARAYYLFGKFSMDDQTYTHLSARIPGSDSYLIAPLGLLFSEVTPSRLLEVSCDGKILSGEEHIYNVTGNVIHGSLYRARPDIHAIFHLHTHATVAVSAMKEGLLPLSQFAYHFYDRLAYYRYDALALSQEQHGANMAEALGDKSHMLLENHGSLTTGRTVEEAFFYMMFLENACRSQIAALAAGRDALIMPPEQVIRQAQKDMTEFEQGAIGVRDFSAHCRVTRFPW